jgi:hypothetical protein
MPVLSKNQKRLRAVDKKIRQSKPEDGPWDMGKIERLEKEREIILNLIHEEIQKAKEKETFKNMTGDQAIEFFKEEPQEKPIDHSIPNTPHTRRLRKKVINNLHEHMLSEMMNQQIRIRMNIMRQLKENLDKEKDKEVCNEASESDETDEVTEFNEVKKTIQQHLHLKTI